MGGDFFRGSPIRKEYRKIRGVMTGRSGTEEPLRLLLDFATAHCKFYESYKGMPLASFPVVNKSVIRENIENIRVPEDENPHQTRGVPYHVQKTSGSTGTPFAMAQDSRKRNRRLAELKYYGEEVGFRSHDELLQLRIWTKWQNKGWWQGIMENITPFDCSVLDGERLRRLFEIVEEKSIKSIRAYAHSYDLIARHAMENGCRPHTLRVLIAGSEALTDTTRSLVEQAFPGVPIISQYANEECGILAQEHPWQPGIFHINRAGYILEVLKEGTDEPAGDGELGRIVLTDLTNYATPVIRYDTGDMGILQHDESGVPYLAKLYGRKLDLIFSTSGKPVYPMYFARGLKNFKDVLQWQFIQEGMKTYALKLNWSEPSDEAERQMAAEIRAILGDDAEIRVERVADIPVLKSGKRQCVVNKYSPKP